MRLAKNDTFSLDDIIYKVIDVLGEGGQGEVYLVSDGTNSYAFKYYKEIPDSDFKYNLKNNITKGSPSANFIWPKKYIEFEDDTCGYLMDIRPSDYVSFVSYLTGKNPFKDLKTKLTWCIELVESFKLLHEKGFSYQDLNDGSFFLNPNNGKLLICDNDNVSADKTNLGILGKMRYMAPEIVRGDKDRMSGERQMPDTHSDRFSLAIILFLTLCLGNPFEGEVLKNHVIVDEKAEFEMFGKNPIYIYSEYDKSNRPIQGYHTAVLKYYPLLPSYIKEAFHKTFTDGLKDRENSRTTEIEWLRLLSQYRDELITCPHCGKEYIFGYSEKKANLNCPFCHNKTKDICLLTIGRKRILLEPGKYLYAVHLNKYSNEYNCQIGKVIQNKSNPSLWGIKLRVDNDVTIQDKNGHTKIIAKDGVIPIIDKLTIQFDNSIKGEIEKQ